MDFSLAGISIQQIIVFLCVAEYEGFAKASDYLHMTQSAVSKSVAKMEKELGIELFQRTTREDTSDGSRSDSVSRLERTGAGDA